MSKLKVLNIIFIIYLVFYSSISNAKTPVMCVSDWPVWEMARVVPSASKFEIIYENYRTCINQFIYGKLDITFLALYDFIRIQQQNQNGKIISVTDYSNGGDKIVAKKNYEFKKENREIVYMQVDSLSLYLFYLFLNKIKMDMKDFEYRNIKAENIKNAYFTEQAKIFVSWNPHFEGIEQKGYKVIASSKDFPKKIFDVIVVKKSSFDEFKNIYEVFLKEYINSFNNQKLYDKISNLNRINTKEYINTLSDAYI